MEKLTAIEVYNKVQSLNDKQDTIPYNVWTAFGETLKHGITIQGDQICLGEDYKSLSEVKEVIEWLSEQFGGVVLWEVEGE
jgi:hypothetical protein